MPRRSSYREPPDPEPKVFRSVAEIEVGVRKLQRRLAQIEALAQSNVPYNSPEVDALERDLPTTILEVFGANSPEYREHQYEKIWQGPKYIGMSDEYCQSSFAAGLPHAVGIVRGLLRRLEEAREDLGQAAPAAAATPAAGPRVFIGHGRAETWRQLKDLLVDRLGLQFEEFNRESAAGLSTKERLEAMLDSSRFAFLVMTGDDTRGDGARHARDNVVHEVGLFQGRHGFRRAIVLLEEGCEEFSNIKGLTQIRFPVGSILAKSEEIRAVLEREGMLAPPKAPSA